MLLNCDNALQAYLKLHLLLTPAQRIKLLKIEAYKCQLAS